MVMSSYWPPDRSKVREFRMNLLFITSHNGSGAKELCKYFMAKPLTLTTPKGRGFQEHNKVTIIGNSPSLLSAIDLALKAARTDSPVFIFGESGVGKELFAKFVQEHSYRHDKPFITINCATITEYMAGSEFFGHKKGAFTDAKEKGVGKFEAANGGTLFLDEIGDLSLPVQAKLLRVLQEKEIIRIGENKPVKMDVRIIAATNKNIPEMIAKGEFREDLFYRFNNIPLEIPPLRDCSEDIPELAKFFLSKNDGHYDRYFHPKTLLVLKQNTYCKNNIRELNGIIEFAATLADDDPCINPEHIKFPFSSAHIEKSLEEPSSKLEDENDLNIAQNVTPLVLNLAQRAMTKHSGKKRKAARDLGISIFLLENLLKNFNISSRECLQYILPYNKIEENFDTSSTIRKRHKKQKLVEKLDPKSTTVVEMAKISGQVTNLMIQDKLEISSATAKRLLSSIVKLGVLHKEGNGRGACYVLYK